MRHLLPLPLLCLLAGCGMKGDLYEVPPPAEPAAATDEPAADEPAADEPDKGERKTIPATPDPARAR